jgi:alpha-ribazole phosphatase
MRVTLVRHTTVDVPRMICYGQTDVPLKESFEEEATVVRGKINPNGYDHVYCSPLSRCVRLAEFCGYKDATRDNRLKEINFGEWEWTFMYSNPDPRVSHWFENQLTEPMPSGESFLMIRDRFRDFLQEKKAEQQDNLLVFTHGGIFLSAELLKGKTFNNDFFDYLPPYGTVAEYEF